MTPEQKSITTEIKLSDEKGAFEAVIATFGVVDSDGDIVEPGAFSDRPAPIMPAHDHGSVALGKARIEERGEQAVAVGRFNLDVAAARDWHSAIKFDLADPPAVQEWSWGYYVLDGAPGESEGRQVRRLHSLDVTEISPVLRGASVGTRTLAAKALERHTTETSDAPWDRVENLRRLTPEARKALGDLPLHHFVGEKGDEGPASTRACIAGIAALAIAPGVKGRRVAYDHLAGHLKDAGIEPPELPSEPSLSLVHQVQLARYDAEAAVERIRSVSEMRRQKGSDLSDEIRAESLLLAAEVENLATALSKVRALAEVCEPDDPTSRAVSAWAASQARRVLAT